MAEKRNRVTMGTGIESAALAIALNLVSAGILRASSIPLAKATRLHKVQGQLKKLQSHDPVVASAFRDFEDIFAKEIGGIDINHYTFFQEIERSGLIQYIAESAIIDPKTNHARSQFVQLYTLSVNNDEHTANRIYDDLKQILHHSVRAMLKDRALGFYLDAIHRHLESKIERMQECLDHYQTLDNSYTPQQISEYTQKIAKSVQAKNRNLTVETNKGPRKIEIKRLFIKSDMKLRTAPDFLDSSSKFAVRFGTNNKRRERAEVSPYEPSWDDPSLVTYTEFKRGFHRAVVLGDPGGGKTTLCQNVCYEVAAHCAHALAHSKEVPADQQLTKLPIRIVLRSYEKARNAEPQLDLFDYICRDIKGIVNLETAEIQAAILYNLTYGGAIIAFDGLDEILDTSKRREFVELVDDFANRFALCLVLVTSRQVGYADAPLPEDYIEFGLEQFDTEKVREFVQKFLRVIHQNVTSKREMDEQAKVFVEQTSRTASDLRKNPLMFGLMTWLFYMKGDVPSNRPEIYKECALLMFERWDQNRGIRANVPGDFDLLHLFSELAARIYGDPDREEGVGRNWLEKEIHAFFGEQYSERGKAVEATKLLITFVTGRSWIMTEVGDGIYKFTHRTFLEFFFARHIEEKHDSISEVFRELKPHVEREEWDVVSHLALQLKSYRNQRRVSELLEILQGFVGRKIGVKKRLACLFFVAKSLEYLPGPEKELSFFVRRCCDEIFYFVRNGNVRALECLRHLSYGSIERRAFVKQEIEEILSSKIKSGEEVERVAIAEILGGEFRRMFSPVGSAKAEIWLPDEMKLSVRESVKAMVQWRAESDAFYALLCVEWYRDGVDKVGHRFGIDLLAADRRRAAPNVVEASIVLVATEMGGLLGPKGLEGGKEFLGTIGEMWPGAAPFGLRGSAVRESRTRVGREFVSRIVSRRNCGKRVLYGGIALIMAVIEIAERQEGVGGEAKGGREARKKDDGILDDRRRFAKTKLGGNIRAELVPKPEKREFFDRWVNYQVAILEEYD